MRYHALFALLLVSILVLGGCPSSTKTTDTGGGTTARPVDTPAEPGGEAAPVEPAEPTVAEPTHPTAKIATLQVGDARDDEKGEITNATKVFAPDTAAIYVQAGVTGLTKGEKVEGTLMAVDVTDTEGTQIRDVEVATTELEAPGEESTFDFKFSAPTKGWPVGSYVVDIKGNGELIEQVPLTCEAPE